jgi:amidohydrolase
MDSFEKWLVCLRREFHMEPEIAFQEKKTSARAAEILRGLGLDVKTGIAGTGVTALLKGKKPGKTILLRADMDALPVYEKNDVEYKSKVPGMMHACGHDAHTAVLLGAARRMVEEGYGEKISGNIKFVFQPAEEGVRGARAMIEEGVMSDPVVDASFAGHVSNDLPCGEIGIYENISHASSDRFILTVRGRGCHAASPEKGSDSIVAACFFVAQIQTIVSRNADPVDPAVVSVGIIRGGTAQNILPDEVVIEGTTRAFNENTRQMLKKRLSEFSGSLAAAFDLDGVDFEYVDGCPPCVHSPEAVEILREAAFAAVGRERVSVQEPKMGAEDFAYFARKSPSAFFRLGTANPQKKITGNGHSPFFDIDEDALLVGVDVFTQTVKKFFEADF